MSKNSENSIKFTKISKNSKNSKISISNNANIPRNKFEKNIQEESKNNSSPKLNEKNKDKKYIESRCVICLSDFEIGEKVSALPCCHSFHTKCLDEWITRNQKCPICKFEVTLKNLLGEDFIKMNLERIEKERIEKEKIEKEKREKERIRT